MLRQRRGMTPHRNRCVLHQLAVRILSASLQMLRARRKDLLEIRHMVDLARPAAYSFAAETLGAGECEQSIGTRRNTRCQGDRDHKLEEAHRRDSSST